MGFGKVGFSKDEMCSYKHTHNSAVHIHELGHTFGLRHIDKEAEGKWENFKLSIGLEGNPQYRDDASDYPNNVMKHVKDNTATEIDRDQIETGVEEYNKGNLNQSEDD